MTRYLYIAASVAMAALLAGCSGGGGESDTAAETATPSAPAGAPAATDVSTNDGVAFASLKGDAVAGKQLFTQCNSCHVTDAGVNKTGPTLHGLIGRKAGSIQGYNYSAANAKTDIVWSKEKLFQYLEKPQRVMPGTKMIFAGLPDAQKRADLIAYLENPS